MKNFGTHEHSLCLFEDAFPAENRGSKNFDGRGSDRLFPFEKATIISVQPTEKGAIFSGGLDEKSLIINFSYNLYRFARGNQKTLLIRRVFQKNLRDRL